MTVFFDPTEVREGSKIIDLARIGRPLPGLERATAADLAIIADRFDIPDTALAHPKSEEIARLLRTDLQNSEIAAQVEVPLPVVLKVNKFYEAIFLDGSLVQRKSGSDFLGSIPNLGRILEKMLVWTRHPWLLLTGVIEETPTRRVKVNGMEFEWSYSSIMSTITAWQERGGYVIHLANDRSIEDWLKRKAERTNTPLPARVITVREPIQQLINESEADAWASTLMTFKGIGAGLAGNIAKTFGTLADALCFVSDPTAYKWEYRPEGFGPIISKYARQRLGLQDGEYLRIVQDNPIEVEQPIKQSLQVEQG